MITTLRITGMTCNGCVKHVDKALRGVPGVRAVQVTLPDRASVEHEDSASLPAMLEAVESAGYQAVTQGA